jgi:hypothetical protein
MMFEEKMQAIKDDVLPFGVIDDGIDDGLITEGEFKGWHSIDTIGDREF